MSADGAEWVYSPWALVLAVCASVVANGVCGRFVYLHLSHWSAPRQQVYIVRILNTIPVYSVASCLCLRFPGDAAVYFEVLRDVYEAFVVYSFMMLVLEYVGRSAAAAAAAAASTSTTLAVLPLLLLLALRPPRCCCYNPYSSLSCHCCCCCHCARPAAAAPTPTTAPTPNKLTSPLSGTPAATRRACSV